MRRRGQAQDKRRDTKFTTFCMGDTFWSGYMVWCLSRDHGWPPERQAHGRSWTNPGWPWASWSGAPHASEALPTLISLFDGKIKNNKILKHQINIKFFVKAFRKENYFMISLFPQYSTSLFLLTSTRPAKEVDSEVTILMLKTIIPDLTLQRLCGMKLYQHILSKSFEAYIHFLGARKMGGH